MPNTPARIASPRNDVFRLSRDGDWNHHPKQNRKSLDETIEPDEVWLRVEHQILYRLPRTSGILFGIRLEIIPWRDILQITDAKAGLRRSLQAMPDEIASYKGVLSARAKIIEWLMD